MATDIDQLATLLQGRTISGTAQSGGETTVRFADGSSLVVQTPSSSSSNSASTGGTVSGVTLADEPPTLYLETDSGSMPIPLAGKTGGLKLQGKNGSTEYPAQ